MIAMSSASIVLKKNAPAGTIILNRPERHNALSREIIAALQQAFDDFHGERSVRAVIVAGSGDSFCSGADLRELAETAEDQQALSLWQTEVEQLQQLLETMLRYPKPILIAATGWVVGSGLSLLLAGDYVIAGESTRLWLPEAIRGLSAGLTTPLLVFRAGAGQANRFLYQTEPIPADQAAKLGLIQEVVADNLVWARAQQLATELARGSSQSHLLGKQLLNQTVGENLLTQLAIGAAQVAAARTTDAAREGVQAFLEKREPKF
jgi:enoyl-CoA hydratase/carnithine racemase